MGSGGSVATLAGQKSGPWPRRTGSGVTSGPASLTAEHPNSGPASGPVSVSLLLVQAKVDGCEKCRSLFNKEGRVRAPVTTAPADGAEEPDEEKEGLKNQLREMELELAQTKLQLVEAECKIQVSLDPCAQLPTTPCSDLR